MGMLEIADRDHKIYMLRFNKDIKEKCKTLNIILQ